MKNSTRARFDRIEQRQQSQHDWVQTIADNAVASAELAAKDVKNLDEFLRISQEQALKDQDQATVLADAVRALVVEVARQAEAIAELEARLDAHAPLLPELTRGTQR